MGEIITKKDVQDAVLLALQEYDQKKLGDRLYTVNQIRKRLGRSHSTITKRIKEGLIRTTKDGLVSEKAINEYLKESN